MKSQIFLVFATAVLTGNAFAVNLLFFGNSFSIQDDVPGHVAFLAVADGKTNPLVVSDLQSGQDAAYHLGQINNFPGNNVSNSAITGKTWDYVIIQGYSTEATVALGNPTAFRANALSIYDAIADHSPVVKAVLFQTWAREPGHSYYPGTFTNANTMQSEISANYALANADINSSAGSGTSFVAPVGDAFQSLGFTTNLYDSDKYHADTAGSLLASMILYRTIYGENVSDITYSSATAWAGVDETTWNSLVATADAMAIPEPSLPLLVGIGAFSLLGVRRRTS